MPIRLVTPGDRGPNGPLVICDQCDEQILTADQGNYEWESGPRSTPVFFTHKTCSDAFRRDHPEIENSEDLDLFALYLNNNLGIDLKAAQQKRSEQS